MFDRDGLIDLVDCLIDEYGMAEYFHTHFHDKTDMCDWVRKSGVEEKLNLYYTSGATKGVIVPADGDYVIKFNLIGETCNYCGREYENWCLAEEAGLSQYFAETIYLTSCGKMVFYAQRMAVCDETAEDSMYYTLRDRYEADHCEYDVDNLWNIIDEMEADERVELLFGNDKLCDFIRSRHINDLHGANFGMIDGQFVLIDYSGFGRQVFEE